MGGSFTDLTSTEEKKYGSGKSKVFIMLEEVQMNTEKIPRNKYWGKVTDILSLENCEE